MSKRTVLYARVSTDEQAEKGYSLPSQLDACRRYAQAHDLIVVAEVTDEFSGAKLDRPGLDRVRALIAQGQVDSVVVHTADRLSRNLAHMLVLREEWQRLGIELHYVNRGKSEDTAEGRLTENIEGVIAEFEREKIKERTRRGKIAKALSGKMIMDGRCPYGTRRVGKRQEAHLVPCEDKLEVVRNIFEWFVNGDTTSGPLNLYRISERLYELKIPSPGSRGQLTHWGMSAVRRILVNEIYAGRTYYSKSHIAANGEKISNPRDQWIPIDVPGLAVISREMFEAAQVRLARNKRFSRRNSHYEYLISGYIVCQKCTRRMYGTFYVNRAGERRHLYKCPSNIDGLHPCPRRGRSVPAERCDAIVWDWLRELLSDDAKLQKGINEMVARRREEQEPKRQRLAMVENLIDKADQKIARLTADLAESEGDDEAVKEAIRKHRTEIAKERNALMEERDPLKADLAQRDITENDITTIKTVAATVRKKLGDRPTYEQKRELFSMLDLRAEVHGERGFRQLYVTCGLTPQGLQLAIDLPSL